MASSECDDPIDITSDSLCIEGATGATDDKVDTSDAIPVDVIDVTAVDEKRKEILGVQDIPFVGTLVDDDILDDNDCWNYAKQLIECDDFGAEDNDEHAQICIGGKIVAVETVATVRCLKKHQIEGIRFMFNNVIADSGCILAHEMGLGKTVQVVSLCDILLKHTKNSHIVCVVPVNTLENWRSEFIMWLPDFKELHVVNEKSEQGRLTIISDWQVIGGVLLIGYEMFRSIVLGKSDCGREILFQVDTLICDEGHRLKNETSSTYVTLDQIPTPKRIILTGYPIQNHVKEYFSMVNFVRRGYLRSVDEFSNIFMEPIQKAHFEDSSTDDKVLMSQRAFVLNTILTPVVQRRAKILENTLPQKFDLVIPVSLTLLQWQLLHTYYNEHYSTEKNVLMAYTTSINICNHPDIIAGKNTPWAGTTMAGYEQGKLESSPKMKILFAIIGETLKTGDRLVVFSQSISTLDVVESLLNKQEYHWNRGENYYRFDGTTNAKLRMELVDVFNKDEKVKLFLISTKAGGMGINVVGANRLVLLDANWNPCHDNQAIARVYRYHQTKKCYIYRLISENSFERLVYDKQIRKQKMAGRVIDRINAACTVDKNVLMELLSKFDCQTFLDPEGSYNYDDVVITKVIAQCGNEFAKEPFPHEEILRDLNDGKLSKDEQKSSIESYIADVSRFVELKAKCQLKREYRISLQRHPNIQISTDEREPTHADNALKSIHSRVGVDKWKQQGVTAKMVIAPKDINIVTSSRTIPIKCGQEIIVISYLTKCFVELLEGVVSVKDVQLQTELKALL